MKQWHFGCYHSGRWLIRTEGTIAPPTDQHLNYYYSDTISTWTGNSSYLHPCVHNHQNKQQYIKDTMRTSGIRQTLWLIPDVLLQDTHTSSYNGIDLSPALVLVRFEISFCFCFSSFSRSVWKRQTCLSVRRVFSGSTVNIWCGVLEKFSSRSVIQNLEWINRIRLWMCTSLKQIVKIKLDR